MTFEIAFAYGVLVVALVFWVRDWFAPELVAVAAALTLTASGILGARETFQAFGNEALVTVAAMFVISAGLTRTGAVGWLGGRLLALGGRSEPRLLLVLMLASALCSAVVNNTPVVAIFLPIALSLSDATGVRPSKLLIPLSYATIVGGMTTILGTSTNVLVSSMLPDFGLPRLALLEPWPLAVTGLVATLAYMLLVGRRLLPSRATMALSVRGGRLHEYVTELSLPPESPLVGRTVGEAVLDAAPRAVVLEVVRGGRVLAPRRNLRLRQDDVVLVKGGVNDILALQRTPGIDVTPELVAPGFEAKSRDITLVELLVGPGSAAIGARVRDLRLHDLPGVAVLAVQRHGLHIREKVADLRLRFGDQLLVQTAVESLPQLSRTSDFVLVEGVAEEVVLSHKAWIALSVVAAVVLVAALQIPALPISVLAVAGALVMVAGGCISPREAYRSIDLPILVLIGGTIAIGLALEESGAAAWTADHVVTALRPLGPLAMVSGVYLVTNVLTALISNNGAAVMMLPIAIAIAHAAGLEPLTFVVAVMFAASIDFSTPFGYQTNTFVYGPGGYRFSDYLRVGGPLNLLWWLLATALLPVFWPLTPVAG